MSEEHGPEIEGQPVVSDVEQEDKDKVQQFLDEPKAAEPAKAVSGSTDEVVESWFRSHIHGSVIGRNTECWNHMVAAVDDLKSMLRRNN